MVTWWLILSGYSGVCVLRQPSEEFYYAVQINVLYGYMSAVHATFYHVYLDSRVHISYRYTGAPGPAGAVLLASDRRPA